MTTDLPGKLRIFIALPVDDPEKRLGAVHEALDRNERVLKTVAPENYHITLKFLGAMDPAAFTRLHDNFARLVPPVPPVSYSLKGLGAFPDPRRARVIWCGIEADGKSIALLFDAIEELCGRHGFPRETRSFTPHLTLARARRDARIPAGLANFLNDSRDTLYGASRFDRIVLYTSDLTEDGPVYTAVSQVLLG